MEKPLPILAASLVLLAGSASGCGTTAEVEKLYIGGWIFLAFVLISMLILFGLVVRYLAAGRKAPPAERPKDNLPPHEDTGDPNDWV